MERFAALARAEGDAQRAARLFGAAAAVREAIGSPLPPVDRPWYEREVDATREALGEKGYTTAWAEGRAMTWEEKVADSAGPWELSNWLYCFDPSEDEGAGRDRSWWWWDAGVDGAEAGWIDVATTGWPFGTGSLYWLIEASGGRAPGLLSRDRSSLA